MAAPPSRPHGPAGPERGDSVQAWRLTQSLKAISEREPAASPSDAPTRSQVVPVSRQLCRHTSCGKSSLYRRNSPAARIRREHFGETTQLPPREQVSPGIASVAGGGHSRAFVPGERLVRAGLRARAPRVPAGQDIWDGASRVARECLSGLI